MAKSGKKKNKQKKVNNAKTRILAKRKYLGKSWKKFQVINADAQDMKGHAIFMNLTYFYSTAWNICGQKNLSSKQIWRKKTNK